MIVRFLIMGTGAFLVHFFVSWLQSLFSGEGTIIFFFSAIYFHILFFWSPVRERWFLKVSFGCRLIIFSILKIIRDVLFLIALLPHLLDHFDH